MLFLQPSKLQIVSINIIIWILGGFDNENVFQLMRQKNNKISSFKCNCNKEQSCNSFYTGGKNVSSIYLLFSPKLYINPHLYLTLTLISLKPKFFPHSHFTPISTQIILTRFWICPSAVFPLLTFHLNLHFSQNLRLF